MELPSGWSIEVEEEGKVCMVRCDEPSMMRVGWFGGRAHVYPPHIPACNAEQAAEYARRLNQASQIATAWNTEARP